LLLLSFWKLSSFSYLFVAAFSLHSALRAVVVPWHCRQLDDYDARRVERLVRRLSVSAAAAKELRRGVRSICGVL